MKIRDAQLGQEYILKALGGGVNRDFIDAKIKFVRVTGSYYSIEYTQRSGQTGATDIGITEGAWEIVPIIKDWDQ